jgi:nucleoside-diphosphate-sugar epimerase
MRVLVTGATGNVGTSLLTRLAKDPGIDSVLGLARRMPDPQLLAGSDLEHDKLAWAVDDLVTSDLEPHLDGVDAVVHLAWLFQPTHQPETTWRANVGGTARLLEAAERVGVPTFVHASSVGAYSPGTTARPVDEDWPTDGASSASYAREKAYVERMLDAFELRNAGCRVVRMRPGFIFQRSSAVQQRRLFAGPLAPTSLVARKRIPLLPMPRSLRLQILHSDDAASAYQAAVHRPVRGAFNIASDPVLGPQELAEILQARFVPMSARVIRAGMTFAWAAHLVPAEPALWDAVLDLPVMDTTRARRELGWSPAVDAPETMRHFLAGLDNGQGGATPPLAAATSGPGRSHEVATGIGEAP